MAAADATSDRSSDRSSDLLVPHTEDSRSFAQWKFTSRIFWEPVKIRKVRYLDGTFSPEEPMHEDWLELLTDLLFVAFYMKLSGGMADVGWAGGTSLFFSFVVFWNMNTANVSMTQWINMYAGGGLVRLLLLGLIPLGFTISLSFLDAGHVAEDAAGFTTGFVITRIALAVLRLNGWLWNRDMGSSQLIVAVTHLAAAIVVISGTAMSTATLAVLSQHLVAAAVELAGYLVILPCSPFWKAPKRAPGMNIGHFQGRMGIAIMVALGESIIQILNVEVHEVGDLWRNALSLGGFSVAFNIALIYFDSLPHNIAQHVLRKSWRRSVIWRYIFPLLIFSIFIIGFCFEVILSTAREATHGGEPHAGGTSHEEHRLRRLTAELMLSSEMPVGAPIRRLSGHLHHDWTLDLGLLMLSISIGVAHLLLTAARFVHADWDGVGRVRLAWHLALGVCHFCVANFGRWLDLALDRRALLEVWLHWALTLPIVLSTLRGQSHGDHDAHASHPGQIHGDHDAHASHPAGPAPGVSFAESNASRATSHVSHAGSNAHASFPMPTADFTCDPFLCKTEAGVPQIGSNPPSGHDAEDLSGNELRYFSAAASPNARDVQSAASDRA